MSMANMVLMRGLPGSGKTTHATYLKIEGYVRANRDDIRMLMFGRKTGLSFQEEESVSHIEHKIVHDALRSGRNVVIDDMNLRPRYCKEWKAIANQYGAAFLEVTCTTNVEECVRRNAERDPIDQVPERVIRDLARKYLPNGDYLPVPDVPTAPQFDGEQYVPDETKPMAIIVDIDGTVATLGDRGWYEYDKVHLDTPNDQVVNLVAIMGMSGYDLLFVSGRDGSCKDSTEEWLALNVIVDGEYFSDWKLFMREPGDSRQDAIVKREIFDKYIRDNYNVQFVLDDRNSVVQMWRDLGLTCLQVAPGDF